MQYINHVTLNTGHTRKSYPNEVNRDIYFILNRVKNDAFNQGAKIFDKYTLKGTKLEYGAIFTLYGKNDIPILTTASTRKKDQELWNLLHETATLPLFTKKGFQATAPYIVDRLELGFVTDISASEWTGDMTKCLGWITLFPDQIR